MAYLPPYEMLKDGIAVSPDGQAVLMSRDLFRLLTGSLAKAAGFDAEWYRSSNQDVDQAIADGELGDAFEHFNYCGYEEGRLHAPQTVDAAFYLETYPDVGEALEAGEVANVEEHYEGNGYLEGRARRPEDMPEIRYWQAVVAESAELIQSLRTEAPAEAGAPPRPELAPQG